MKNAPLIGVVFFILALLAKDVTAIGWQIWYRVNVEYVAKNLCENKAKPAMKCNGKCYLAKQLAKTEGTSVKKEKQQTPVLKLKPVEGILTFTMISTGTLLIAEKQQEFFCYRYPIADQGMPVIDHPPTV